MPGNWNLRADLEFSSQTHQGKSYVVVKDPVTGRYFRFTQAQSVLLELLRRPVTAEVLASEASLRLGAEVTIDNAEAFLRSLAEKSLIDTAEARDQIEAYRGRKKVRRNLLYWRLASVNPERVFAWLDPRTRWFFTRGFHALASASIITGFVLTAMNADHLAGRATSLISVQGLALIWLVILGVVTLHEFAHGLTCRHYGGKVQELGFMLIYFQPALYCDVSDSWMFPSKQQRLWVTFAGGYFQLAVWGIAAIIWRVTAPETFVNQMALAVILFAGLQTFVNFNPLIKLDGYYILSDYLEIPNLREKAVRAVWARLSGRRPALEAGSERRALMIYGTASIVFSTFLLLGVYAALYTYATRQYAFAGLLGFLMFSSFTLRRTASESIAGLRAVASSAVVRKYRVAGVSAAGLLVAFLGQWELKIAAEFKVVSKSEILVRAETGGTISEVLVREGGRVKRGDVLARLQDFGKLEQLSELTGELEKKRAELSLLRAGTRAEEIERVRKLVETREVELANARRYDEERRRLQQTLERKRAELRLDEQNLSRARELFTNGLAPRMDVDRAETAVQVRHKEIAEIEAAFGVLRESSDREADLRTKELAEANSQLKLLLAGSRPESIRQLEGEVQNLADRTSIIQREIARTEVRAPIDGVIATPLVERKLHQHLDTGDEFARLVELDRVIIEMQVPEKEMSEVHEGYAVWMKVRGFPASDFEGEVEFISPVAQAINNQPMIVVRSEIANPGLLLKPDMTGVAKIYCGKRRIGDLMTRRIVRWIRTEFWDLLP